VADKEMAEYEQIKVKTEISPSQESTPARSGSPKKKASKYFADADESEVLTNEDAARLIGNNYKVHVAKRALRTLANKRRGEMRKNGAITLQRVWRGHVDRVKHRTILMLNKNELVQSCATKLQSVYRGHLARELALKIRVREARKSVFLSRYLIHDVAMPQFTPKEGAEGAALREQTIEHYQQLCKLMLFGRESCTAEDTKRPKGNPFRNVLIRFHNTREQHVRELMAMRKIFGTLQDLPTLKETLTERPLSYVSIPVHHSLAADVASSPVVSRSCIVFKQPQMLLSEYIADKRFDNASAPYDSTLMTIVPKSVTQNDIIFLHCLRRDSGKQDAIVVREIVDAMAFLHENGLVHTTLNEKSFGLVGGSWALVDLGDCHAQGDELELDLPNLRTLPVPEVIFHSQSRPQKSCLMF
jgi:hypothetical protein